MSRVKKGLLQNKFVRVGVPMITFSFGCLYLLGEFMQTHVEMKDKKTASVSKRKFDLEEEHTALMKKLDIDNSYSLNARIPRPGEEKEKEEAKKAKSWW